MRDYLSGDELTEALKKIRDNDLVQAIRDRDLEHRFEEDVDCPACAQREFDNDEAVINETEALRVYYAMHQGDMEAVKSFVCRAAGRIA